MANVIKLKNSGTANTAPASLEYGEIAINYADGVLFYKNASNTIISFDIVAAINAGNASSDVADLEVSVAMQAF